jgi:hypothetical protein
MRKLCIVLAVVLGACNSGGDGGHGGGDMPAPDLFVARVQALAAGSADDADPVELDGIAATTPEDTDPLPL